MRDIWGVPPGGFEATEKKKRPWLRATIAGTLILAMGIGGGVVVSSMNKSTEVGADKALAEFRAHSSSQTDDSADESSRGKGGSEKKKQARSSNKRDSKSVDNSGGSAPAVAAGNDQANTAPSQEKTSTDQKQKSGYSASQIGPPEEGVYSWTIDGYEEAPGVHRNLPKHSNRVITHEGGNDWTEHHIFSEQREQWFGLGISQEGVFTRTVRNRVEMGPVEVDKTIDYNPPMFVSLFPWDVGQTWDGAWKGKTSGKYSAKCFEHGYMTIGGERVEVYVTEVSMEMHGDVEGTTTVRSWVAPDYRLVVKQYQESRVETGPGEYYSEWTGQVDSLHPQT